MAGLEAQYVERTGVKSLKVRHNNILGFFIEVTQGNAKPLLEPPLVGRRSATARRWPTPCASRRRELIDTEGRIASASRARAEPRAGDLRRAGGGGRSARSAGSGASPRRWPSSMPRRRSPSWREPRATCGPRVDDSQAFEIRGGRHPVVEQALKAAQGRRLHRERLRARRRRAAAAGDETPDGRIWLVTGPNMAGKSTFLRQNALIVVLAQMGSFVPARSATIGVVDRLFSRVGASDDLARGRSTFMVEMVETAAILNQASDRSLVILDEIGRGTATFDGLSIAWATVEFLHDVLGARAAVRHALSRADGARPPPRRRRQRDHRRARVARRDRLPAQGEAGRRRPLLRHPGRQAGRPARRRSSAGRARCWRCSRRPTSRKNARNGGLDELPLFAVSRPSSSERSPPAPRRSSRRSMP